MLQLTGKWHISAQLSGRTAVPAVRRRLVIAGTRGRNGEYPLAPGVTVGVVSGRSFSVEVQTYDVAKRQWIANHGREEVAFERGTGTVIRELIGNRGRSNPLRSDVVVTCIARDKLLMDPFGRTPRIDLTLPLSLLGAVPVPCPGDVASIDVSTGIARWVRPDGQPAATVAVPNLAWAARLPAQWVDQPSSMAIGNPIVGGTGTQHNKVNSSAAADQGVADGSAGTYVYALDILVPGNCAKPINAVLSGIAFADNRVTLRLNGTVLLGQTSPATPTHGFVEGNGVTFSQVLTPGAHRLSAEVYNAGGPTGLLVKAAIAIS